MNEENISVEFRKIQENQANLLTAGCHKTIAQWHFALYRAYMDEGFNEIQALDLLKTQIMSGGMQKK